MANRVYIGIEFNGSKEAPTSSITIADQYAKGFINLGDAGKDQVTEMLNPANLVGTVLDNGDNDAIDLIYFASGSGAPLYIGREEFAYDAINWDRIENGD